MQAVRGLTLSLKTSAALRYSNSKRVSVAKSSALNGSTIFGSGRCFSASVASHSSEEPKTSRKKARDERRAAIIAFVDKYRASNAGKFPSFTVAMNQVGGSYYTVRNIIQELEYNSKQAPTTQSKIDKTSLDDERVSHSEALDVRSSENGADLACSARSLERENKSHALAIDNKGSDEATISGAEIREESPRSSEIFFSEAALNHQQIGEPSSSDKTQCDEIKTESKEVPDPCIVEAENVKEQFSSDGCTNLNEPKVVPEDGEEASQSDKMQVNPSSLVETHYDQINLESKGETSKEASSSLEDESISHLEAPDISSSENGVDLTCSAQSLEMENESHTLAIDNKDADEVTSRSSEVKEESLSSSVIFSSEAPFSHQQISEYSSYDETHSDQMKSESKEMPDLYILEAENAKEDMDLNETKVALEGGEEASESDKMQGDRSSDLGKTHSDEINLESTADKENDEEGSKLERSALPRDTSCTKENETESKPSVWGSLRSIADGIINLWRKK